MTIARSKNGPPWIRAVQELPVAAERVFSVLSDFERYAVLFAPHVKTAKILTRDGQSARLHLVWPLPFPMRNRDAVVRYTSAKEDTLYKVRWQHAPESSDPSEGLRIEVVAGETVLTARTPETTSVEYTYFADLGGDLPDFIKEASYKEEPVAYFNALRKHFSLPLSPSL